METSDENQLKLSGDWWNYLPEEDFQATFRVSRKTLVDLQAGIDYVDKVHEDRIESTLLACLWFLGSVKPMTNTSELFNISDVENTLREYLTKLLKLASLYILWPSDEEAHVIENGFIAQYKFPSIIGVIGSLHIDVNIEDVINKEVYFNKLMRKHTIVLQVVCDHNLLLRDVCVGCPGGKGIGSILKCSPLFNVLTSRDNVLTKNNYHLLGGTEHPQLSTLLTPYKLISDKSPSEDQNNFNMMHNTVMSSVERTFRCMENRFPRLTSVEDLDPKFAALVVGSICVLHNFTQVRNDKCELYS